MKRVLIAVVGVMILCSHDLFLKTDQYFLKSNQNAELFLFNGTFDKNENIIARDRITDARVVGPEYRFDPLDNHWLDRDGVTVLKYKTGKAGTYVAGVSTLPRLIELSAEDFNNYLEHDGVLDVLEARKQSGTDGRAARENYAKHVKVLLQVDDLRTDHYNEVFGYPVEFVPVSNPYTKKTGDRMSFQLLKNKKPQPNQLVYLGHRSGKRAPTHEHTHDEVSMRTDSKGIVSFQIDHPGFWFLRTIHMTEDPTGGVDYVSNWATISFEAR